MANRAGSESGDIAGGEASRRRRRAHAHARRRARQRRARHSTGFLDRLLSRGELQLMPRRISRRFHLPLFIELYNVRFFRLKARYLWWQSAHAYPVCHCEALAP